MLAFPSGILFPAVETASAINFSLFPAAGFPPSEPLLPGPDPQKPCSPPLIQRPCPLLPVEMMMGGYAGCPTAADLLNRFREDHCFLSPHFNSYSLYSTRNVKKDDSPSKPGHFFFLRNDFPQHAPEIACMIHRYGDGLYHEEIFFFQRMEKPADSWRQIVHFNLSDSALLWGGAFGGARARLAALTPDSIIILVESVRDGQPLGQIMFRFRLKDRIYRMQSLLISEAAEE